MNRRAGLLILATLTLTTPSRAESNLWQVCVEMQIVSVPTSIALQLVPTLRNPHQAGSAFASLQMKIAGNEATLIAWPVIWTKSGQRGESESIEEARYPTTFDPPQFPQNFGTVSPPASLYPSGMPNAFETRNVGVTLEVNPLVDEDGMWIDLKLAPQRVALFGFERLHSRQPKQKMVGKYDQPVFFTAKTTTSAVVRSGEWKLIATFVVAKPEPHVELLLVCATAHSLGK